MTQSSKCLCDPTVWPRGGWQEAKQILHICTGSLINPQTCSLYNKDDLVLELYPTTTSLNFIGLLIHHRPQYCMEHICLNNLKLVEKDFNQGGFTHIFLSLFFFFVLNVYNLWLRVFVCDNLCASQLHWFKHCQNKEFWHCCFCISCVSYEWLNYLLSLTLVVEQIILCFPRASIGP